MSVASLAVEGHVSRGFEAVREAFAENFTRRNELGGACCAYHRGEKVVDLWGGVRNKATDEPWEQDTMVLIYAATKGLAAMALAVAHSRRWLDYEERVAAYWPEFAQQGKEKITVRQLLAHQAGLFAFDEPVDRSVVADLDRLAVVLARQKPAWEPGTRQPYHAITLGFYEGELLRRVHPRRRSLGQFFQDEIATPLGLDVYIRLPESTPNARLATLAPPSQIDMLVGFRPFRLMLEGMNRRSNIYRALVTNPGFAIAHDEQRVYARNLEVPSGGAVGTARAIAHAYGVFAAGGLERTGAWAATADAGPARRAGGSSNARVLRRVPEGRSAVLAGLHEAEPRLALRQRVLVRVSGIRRLSWLCGSDGRHWIRVRHQPDGHEIHRRSARCGAQRRALRRSRIIGLRFSRKATCHDACDGPHGAHRNCIH